MFLALRHFVFAAIVATTALLPAGAHAQESFTIEQVMSSPFPTALVAAPVGDAIAWVQNAEGRRNVWLAEGPGWEGRPLTTYDRDDGQEVGDLQWTPDANRLVYVRGGAPNRAGDVPNPAWDAEGAERAVWTVGLDGGEPVLISAGARPRISPDGTTVAFIKEGQVWTAALDQLAELPGSSATQSAGEDEGGGQAASGGGAPGPEARGGSGVAGAQDDTGASDPAVESAQLFELRRGVSTAEWSPDGTMMAFVTGRGDHAFVGVYDIEADEVRYLDASIDEDGSPVWSPDSRSVAFIRTPNVQDALPFFPRRSGHPWSIRVADAETGRGREVWRGDEGPGSVFRSISADNQLMWGAGDRLVFPWEKDGWTHLYSVPARGGQAAFLTPGDFEVQFVSLSPDRTEVLFSSNQGDIDRQHIWRVPVGGGRPGPVTSGTGVEWSPVATAESGTVAYLGSGPTEPAMTRVLAGGDSPAVPGSAELPDDFPSDRLVTPEQVTYSSTDGLTIHGQLFLPTDLQPGERRPALLFLHGGSRRQMLLAFHHRGYYHNAYAMNQYLASRGFIVLSVNYRSGIGYGMEFREAPNYGASGGAEVNDVLAAGLYLKGRGDVDPARIGLWGGSYGGYLTAMGLAKASNLFAAGVDFHGVHDWNTGIQNFVPHYVPEHRPEVARTAFEASPLAWVDDWRSPVLMIHGDDDRNVNFNETVKLVERLRARGVETEELVFPDEVHGFLLHRNWVTAYRATADFFIRRLGNRPAQADGGS
jgi:dipeptidyl aminopeptidase/acylaminoacyl peptidase